MVGICQAEISKDYRCTAVGEYLHSYYIKRVLKFFDIDTFTTTYENNPWEKVCLLTLKKYSPHTHIIGYQHAALSRASINMFMSDDEKEKIPLPDRIITIGDATKSILEKLGNHNPNKMRVGCGLRFSHIFNTEQKIERKKNISSSYI